MYKQKIDEVLKIREKTGAYKAGYVDCPYPGCKRKFSYNDRPSHISQHIIAKHEKLKSNICDQCGFATSYAYTLKDHIKRRHNKDKERKRAPFSANIKPKIEGTSRNKHEKTGTSKNLLRECLYADCKRKFGQHDRPSSISQHIIARHEKLKDNVCYTCGFATSWPLGLIEHIKRIHSKTLHLSCSYCNYLSNTKSELQHHIKMVHDKIYDNVCNTCCFASSAKSDLKKHIASKKCLKNHMLQIMQTQNKNMYKQKMDEIIKIRRKTWAYKKGHLDCPYPGCKRKFTYNDRPSHISLHIIAKHEKIKSYSCDQCGFATSYAYTLQDHIKRHHNKDKQCKQRFMPTGDSKIKNGTEFHNVQPQFLTQDAKDESVKVQSSKSGSSLLGCPVVYCTLVFQSLEGLGNHLRDAHSLQ